MLVRLQPASSQMTRSRILPVLECSLTRPRLTLSARNAEQRQPGTSGAKWLSVTIFEVSLLNNSTGGNVGHESTLYQLTRRSKTHGNNGLRAVSNSVLRLEGNTITGSGGDGILALFNSVAFLQFGNTVTNNGACGSSDQRFKYGCLLWRRRHGQPGRNGCAVRATVPCIARRLDDTSTAVLLTVSNLSCAPITIVMAMSETGGLSAVAGVLDTVQVDVSWFRGLSLII